MPPVKTFGERIADALVEDGLLTQKQVEELLEQQKKQGTRLLKLLIEKNYISDLDMVVSMGRVLNTPPVNLARISIPLDIASLPHDAIAEGPTLADRRGCTFTTVGELPPQLLAYMQPHVAQHELFIRAATEGSHLVVRNA